MTVIKCLLQKAEAGRVSKKLAKAVAEEIELLKSKSSQGTDVAKELDAANQAFDLITNRINQKARQVSIHSQLVEEGTKRFSKEGVPVEKILKSFSFTDEADGFKYGFLGRTALESVQHYQRIFTGMAVDVLDKLNPTKMGKFRSPQSQLEIQRDLFALLRKQGKRSSDPEIRKISEDIANLTTKGADAFEAAGGNITKRTDYMLGRSVNSDKVIKTDVEEYVRDGLKAFDLDRVSKATGGSISTKAQLEQALRKDYQAIASGGIADLADFAPKGLKSVVNSRNHHRIFHFTDADAMNAWNSKYGNDSLYQSVVNYAENIGKDIGILESYGPKPEAFLRSMLREAAKKDPVATARYKDTAYRQWRYVTGQWDRSLDPTISKIGSTYRAVNVANKLGLTAIDAAVMDAVGLNVVVKKMRGLPVLKSIFENFKTLSSRGLNIEAKEWARLGWLNEAFLNDALVHLRASEAEGGAKLATNLASGVLKYTGLTRLTNTTKGVNVKQLGEVLARQSWEEMPDAFRKWLGANGFTKSDLLRVQQVGLEEVPNWNGIKVASPAKLHELGMKEEAVKLGTLFNRVQEIVSPTASPELRAWFSDFERGGKVRQALAGSMKTFSGYIGSFYNNHLRVLASMPGYGDKLKWTSASAVSLIASGLVAGWMRDLANGKDPAFTEESLYKAVARSNILPVLGDYIAEAGGMMSRGMLSERIGGIAASDIGTALRAGANVVKGEGVKAGRDVQRLLENLIPGKNAWFAGLAIRRTILDQIRMLYDPKAEKNMRRATTRARNKGTPYWWEPGKVAPSKAPSLEGLTNPSKILDSNK